MIRLRIAAFVALAAALAGCGKSGPSAKLSGTVSYNGRPVPSGAIYLKFDQGGQYEAALKDGTYSFGDLPLGSAKLVVDTETFNPDQKPQDYIKSKGGKKMAAGYAKQTSEYDKVSGGGEKAAATDTTGGPSPEKKAELAKVYVKIPTKYNKAETSPLTVTVADGSQTKNLDLTD